MNALPIHRYASPLGEMLLASCDDALCLADWADNPHRRRVDARIQRALGGTFVEGTSPVILRARQQLDEYFLGARRTFGLPLRFCGTAFQRRVWESLLEIPFGAVISYGEQARRIGSPTAVRAVAAANSQNAITVIVPCHRVIGADGRLTGYAGGLHLKAALLRLEGIPCSGG